MGNYLLQLEGEHLQENSISGLILKELLGLLTESNSRIIRLLVEGRSTSRGSYPSWLDKATDFSFYAQNLKNIRLEALPLQKVVPEKFSQRELFFDLDPSRSCLSLLRESLTEAFLGKKDGDYYDPWILETFKGFSSLFERGITQIEFIDKELKGEGSIIINEKSLKTLENLSEQIPTSRRVRIAGKLDAIRHSNKMFLLQTKSGILRGFSVEDLEIERLKENFGKYVIVSGLAIYRPSGAIQRIEATSIAETTLEESEIWSTLPMPIDFASDRNLYKPQNNKTGMNAIFGKWPGDESEQTILATLEEIS